MSYSVTFEKWIDPLVPLDMYERYYGTEKGDGEDDYELVRNEFRDEEKPFPTPYNGPLYIGPMGLIPLHHGNLPAKLYNFWIAHTNFVLTAKHKKVIESVAGVEILRVFTQYRFWVGIGKSFETEQVQEALRSALLATEPKAPVAQGSALDTLKKAAARQYEHWAIIEDGDRFHILGIETPDDELLGDLGDAKVAAKSWGETNGD